MAFNRSLFARLVLAASAFTAAGAAVSHTMTLKVYANGLVVTSPQQAQEVAVQLAPATLPSAFEGKPYSFNLKNLLTVEGDGAYQSGDVTWGVISSSLPQGLYLTADGYIGGTPTSSGTGEIRVQASYNTAKGEQSYQVVAVALEVTLQSAALPAAWVGSNYSFNFRNLLSSNETGFNSAYATFSAKGLPAGLTLSSTGALTGKPTVKNEAGVNFEVVASYKSASGQQAYTLVVNGVVLRVKQVSAGLNHTCAVTVEGGAKCWGFDGYGQLGNDSAYADSPVPVDVAGLTAGVASISAGDYHSCAVTTSGGLKCWGANSQSQLGDNTTTDKPTPVDVQNLTSSVAMVSAGGYHTCAVTTSGGLKCWGKDGQGQIGNGAPLSNMRVPVDVPGLTTGVATVSAGGQHTCAVTTAGAAKCWGHNVYGRLGDGSITQQPAPVDVFGLASGVADISAGASHTCALTSSGAALCWGAGISGRLGNGTTTDSNVPSAVYGLNTGVVRLRAGGQSTCAVTQSGALKCWGADGRGQLGDDDAPAQKLTPVDVYGLASAVTDVSVGGTHACANLSSSALKCWGYDDHGQLGDNTTKAQMNLPVDVQP